MIVPQRRRAPVSINYRPYRRGFGVWNPPNRADYGLDPGGGGMHCDPMDVACVAAQTSAGNAFDVAMQDAQAQDNFDQCASNASNATSQSQYDQVMQACEGQYAQQGGTSSTPTPSEPISTSYKTPYIVAPVAPSSGAGPGSSSGPVSTPTPANPPTVISSSGAVQPTPAVTSTATPVLGFNVLGFNISSIPWYGWAAAGAAVLFFMGGQRGR